MVVVHSTDTPSSEIVKKLTEIREKATAIRLKEPNNIPIIHIITDAKHFLLRIEYNELFALEDAKSWIDHIDNNFILLRDYGKG